MRGEHAPGDWRMAEPAETEDDLIHGVKMAATAVTAAILTAAIVIAGGQQLAPALFPPESSAPANADEAGVVRIADR